MRKIFSGTLLTVSLVLLALSIAGIVLTWVYNEPLTRESIAHLKEIDLELAQAQTALQNAKVELERTLRLVEDSEKALSALKEDLTQAKLLFGDVNGTEDEGLLPSLESSRSQISQAISALEGFQATLEQLNSLPFVNLDLPGDELLANLIVTANSIDSQITQVEDLAQTASVFLEDASYLMGGDFTETKQNLQEFVTVVDMYEQKVTVWRERVAELKAALPGWIDRASIILTVTLFWLGFSQFGLFLHGLNIWHGGNPIKGLQKTLKITRRK